MKIVLLVSAFCLALGAAPQSPAGGAFATKRYRNLFLEAGHSPKEISAKIDAAFQQLFHGDAETQTVYYPAGRNANGPMAYLTDINNKDVRSEGMSYGMMIAVQLDKKAEFDALWNWSRTLMYHDSPSHPGYGFFSWSMKTSGTPNDESPAPDGEEYWAMALYFAAGRWGSGSGIYDYRAEADRLLDHMKNRGTITGPTVRGPETDGAEFNAEHKMVRFTPNNRRPDHTDPSYHLPAFYELWARWGPAADRPFWAEAAAVSRNFLQKVSHPTTGLVPNYANFDGTPVGTGRNANFGPDAWRTAANWSVDWSWWAADPRERQLSDRIQAFFESKGIDTYGNQFTLDGNQVGDSHSTALVATNAVASLAATDPRAKKFVEALWNAAIPSGQYRYYDGMWYLMGLLHASGEFRIWPPTESAAVFAQGSNPAPAPAPARTHFWWRDQAPGAGRGAPDPNATKMPLISVKGNRFVDPSGKPVLFRGLSISDPDKLEMQGHWNKEHFVKVQQMGATLLRIPVHPVAWRERGGVAYIKLLDQAVEWATDLGMYLMIDWHSIGNMTTGVYQDPMYDTTKEETYGFWRAMSRRYGRHNTVAFFELFNEPAAFGRVSWDAWKTIVEDEIAVIRANTQQVIPLVAGFDWAYDLTPLRLNPIAAEGIGYTVHPYSNKRTQPWEPKWEEDFGFAAAKYPLIATEFGGFAAPGTPIPTTPPVAPAGRGGFGNSATLAAYGPAIIKYLEGKNISWTVWCFDPEWGPTLISDWNYTLNASGQFAKAAMQGEVK